jgi:hypothetical protein
MNRDAWNSHQWSSATPRQLEIQPDQPLRQYHCSRCRRDFVESLSGKRWAVYGDRNVQSVIIDLITKA